METSDVATADGPDAVWRPGITGAPRPPMLRGWPVVGHLPDLLRDPFPMLLRGQRELGPVFRVRAPGEEWVCLAGLEANALLANTGYDYLVTGAAYAGFNEAFRSRSFVIGLDGPEHAHLRRIERRAFSREALSRRLDEAVALTDRCIATWRDRPTVDIVAELKALIVAQLGVTLTGRDASELLDDLQTLLTHIVNVSQLKKWPRFLLRLPHFVNARERVYADMQAIVAEHRRAGPPRDHGDLVDDLLAAKTLTGEPMPDETVFAAAMGAYMAGLDTAAIVASFILYGILAHADVHRRVQPEIDELFARGPITWERLAAMTAFRGACLEALRMYPTVALIPRDAARDFEFAGRQIRRGEHLFLAATATHFDPRVFAAPERFDIDRYAPPRSEHKVANAFAPFGLGPHRCLGGNLGELQAMIVAATILHRLDVAIPRDYRLRVVASPARRPDRSFRLRVLARRRPTPAVRRATAPRPSIHAPRADA